ncbi:MAG: glycosyl transferase, family 2 [Solirubrobacterales bacterium]|nr:glycosyl transferase, family 2 [Solirubrobacterales bacterium]
MTSIGVVIVTYRGGETVAVGLDALRCARDKLDANSDVSVVVVDNASRDGTVERIRQTAPWVNLVELPRNVGFAAACNVGIARSQDAGLVVLLNPDVEVRDDFLARVVALEWRSDIAAVGPAVLDGRGQVEQSARGFPSARTGLLGRTSLFARIWPTSPLLRRDLRATPEEGARPVDWVSGACMVVPGERFQSVGPLDSGYFMYWEDADWCRRASYAGYSVIYDPTLVVTHRQGASSRSRSAATIISFHCSALRYWRKHVSRSPVSTTAAAVALGMRCALKLIALGARRTLAGGRRRVEP